MALVIEDGTIVAGANSFVTRAEVIAYASARGVTLPDTEATDVHAVNAMDYLWSLCFRGSPVDPDQPLMFPRKGLLDGDDLPGYEYTIPAGIKQAQLQLALDSANGIKLLASSNPAAEVKRVKVGPLEREFFAPPSLTLDGTPPLELATALLKPFVCNDAMLLRTIRG